MIPATHLNTSVQGRYAEDPEQSRKCKVLDLRRVKKMVQQCFLSGGETQAECDLKILQRKNQTSLNKSVQAL